jgi:hypothetical protein
MCIALAITSGRMVRNGDSGADGDRDVDSAGRDVELPQSEGREWNCTLKANAGDDDCWGAIRRVKVLKRAALLLTLLLDRDDSRTVEDEHAASFEAEIAVRAALENMVAQGILCCREREHTTPSCRGVDGTKMVMIKVLDSEYMIALAGGVGYVMEGVLS